MERRTKGGILKITNGKQTCNKRVTFEDTPALARRTAPNHEKLNPGKEPVTRRGKRKSKSKIIKHLKILTINIRGVKSKTNSLTSALHMHGTHIAGLTETHLTNNEALTIKGYQWIGKNRDNKPGGGLGFLVRNDIKHLVGTEDSSNNEEEIEMQWANIKIGKGIAMGLFYGKQKSARKEEVERQFQELTTKINEKQRNNNVIVMGDFNAKLELKTSLGQQIESRNGTLLAEVLTQTSTMTVNARKEHTGMWTRVNRKKPQRKIGYKLHHKHKNKFKFFALFHEQTQGFCNRSILENIAVVSGTNILGS
jgi:exonuclease III